MRDLFSQCTYVRVCHAQECQFALSCVTCTDSITRIPDALICISSLAMEDREERHFLTIKNG